MSYNIKKKKEMGFLCEVTNCQATSVLMDLILKKNMTPKITLDNYFRNLLTFYFGLAATTTLTHQALAHALSSI